MSKVVLSENYVRKMLSGDKETIELLEEFLNACNESKNDGGEDVIRFIEEKREELPKDSCIRIRKNKVLTYFQNNPEKVFTFTNILQDLSTTHTCVNYNLKVLLQRGLIIRIEINRELQKKLQLDTRTKFLYKYNQENGDKIIYDNVIKR